MVEVPTKDVGDVKEVRSKDCDYSKTELDNCEKYIKFDLGLRE